MTGYEVEKKPGLWALVQGPLNAVGNSPPLFCGGAFPTAPSGPNADAGVSHELGFGNNLRGE